MKTIAIFKSLGAPINLIEKIYFSQIALIALIGTGIGILIGSFIPYLLTPVISQMVPFTVEPRISFAGLAVPGLPNGSPGREAPNPTTYDVLLVGRDGAVRTFATH